MVALDENGEPITVEAQVLADAVAQLVFTATGFPLDEPILAVRILSNGARTFVPTLEGDTEEVVNRDDFVNYTAEWVPPTTTVAPTSTTQGTDAENGGGADNGELTQAKNARAAARNSGLVYFNSAIAPTSGTRTIVPPWKATIEPKSRSAIALTASMPYQLESARSNEVGVPPR